MSPIAPRVVARTAPESGAGLLDLVAIFGLTGGVVGLLAQSWTAMLLPISALILARRRFTSPWVSPVVLPVLVLSVSAVGGYLAFGRGEVDPAAAGPLQVDVADNARTLQTFVITTIALLAGALLTARPPARGTRFEPLVLSSKARGRLLAGALLPILLFVPSLPVLLSRPIYLGTTQGSILASAAGQLSLAAVAVLGYLLVTERTRRPFVIAGLVIYFLISVGLGSRRIALFPLICALGVYTATFNRRGRLALLGSTVAAILLLPIPLYLRGLPAHGLLNYLPELPHAYSSTKPYTAAVYNALFSYPVVTGTLGAGEFPAHNIYVQMNPLPGRLTDWYAIFDQMRINEAIPFAAVGEVGAKGLAFAAVFWGLIGMLLGYLDRRVRLLLTTGAQFVALTITGLATLFMVLATQYNLRNASRLLYYAVAIDVVVILWRGVQGRRSRPAEFRPRRRAEPVG